MLRELPPEERPRERLWRHGPEALHDAELVAILLRTGSRGKSALVLAREALGRRGLAGLADQPPEALRRKGLGPAKAATLAAAVELGRRLARAELPRGELLSRPEVVARYLNLRYGRAEQEVMGALYLDTKHRLLQEAELFRGTLNRAAVEPALILRRAVLCAAAGLLLFHNHPSGDPAPSPEDLVFTRRLQESAELLGLKLHDHLILGRGGRWVSLRRRGGW